MKIITVQQAAELIKDNDVIGSAVQGMTGWPEEIGLALEKMFLETGHPAGITHIHGAGQGDFGRSRKDGTTRGEDALAHDGFLTRSIHGHIGCSFKMMEQVVNNKILAYNFPLGMMGQIWREKGRGFPGLVTKVGLNTFMDPRHDGCMVNEKTKKEGVPLVFHIPDFMGEEYLLYTLPKMNVALLRGTTSDGAGNITYEKECMPCEPLDLAMATKADGGIVIACVERIAMTGSLDPRDVRVPGILVDYVCVAEHIENQMQTHITHFNPAFTGEIRVDMKKSLPPLPLDERKVACRRATMEIKAGNYCNFGLGMPTLLPNILFEEKVNDKILMISESGLIGGVPAEGGDFGAHWNPEAMYCQTDHFSFFDQGGLDIAVFGLSEVEENGSVNTTFLNGKMVGVGGFPNIAANAKHSIFVGTFTASGLKCRVEDGKMHIDQEGRFKKFVKKCLQISMNADENLRRGNRISYITERCVLEKTTDGVTLKEIAPGIDLQKDILDQMEFKPIIPAGGPKLMDARLFEDTWGTHPMNEGE
jgi:propionate CoA-transferase